MNTPIDAALSAGEIDQLAARLDAIENPDALSLEGVDGLFCALIASPASVLPSVYLPVILGAEPANSGAFADLADAQATMSLLMRYWNSIIADLEQESIHLPFVFEAEPGEVLGREWARGFVVGVDLAPDGWDELFDDENEGDLFVILLAAGEIDPEWPKETVTPKLRDDVLKSMAVGVARAYWRFRGAHIPDAAAAFDQAVDAADVGDVETTVRAAPKVGPNDPCPCGSGKKYKKCCGAADILYH